MTKSEKNLLFIANDITKKQIDNIIVNVNKKLELNNKNWYLRYDMPDLKDYKYFLSFESRVDNQFLSFRNSRFQYKNKCVKLNNKDLKYTDMPDDYVVLSLQNGDKRNGLNIFTYSKLDLYDIDEMYLRNILNDELKTIDCNIKTCYRTSNSNLLTNDEYLKYTLK